MTQEHDHDYTDDESRSDALSPTNGYFGQGPLQADGSVERETNFESNGSRKARSVGLGDSSRQSNGISQTEREPLLDQTQAPPSYSDVVGSNQQTGRYNPPHNNAQYGYGSVSQSEEHNPVSSNQTPEITGSTGGEDHFFTTIWAKRRRHRLLCKITLLALGAFILCSWIILSLRRNHSSPSVYPGPGNGVNIPHMPEWFSQCNSSPQRSTEIFELDDQKFFEFQELIGCDHNDEFRNIRMSSKTYFVPSPPHQESPVVVNVTVLSTKALDFQGLKRTNTGKSLSLEDIYMNKNLGNSRECIAITSIVYMKPASVFENFNIETCFTSVGLDNHLGVEVSKSTQIDMKAGSLWTGSISSIKGSKSYNGLLSRETFIKVKSGSVSGTYSLQDVLSIETKSGSISIVVDPQDDSESDPRPANFSASSNTGSIGVKFVDKDLPLRDYQTSIDSRVGSVTAKIIHGSMTSITSSSGSLDVKALPHSSMSSDRTSILTSVQTGHTIFELLKPLGSDGAKLLSNIDSEHTGNTGSLDIIYPKEWEGMIYGNTTTGSLELRGKDLKIIKKNKSFLGRNVVASKGKDAGNKGKLSFKTSLGSCDVRVG